MTSLLAEAIAVTFDNLTMTVSVFEYVEEATEDSNLSPEARQRLGLVHTALAMAIQAMEHDELRQLIKQSQSY
ncbi:hypothetical protein ACSYAD_33290 [Acaryochloris marina NIES-2412]|uniref:hypothetical protein n=1 Tax=Acaryochloris marina TaxID=155978 RepID=UPI0040587B29